MIIEVHSSGERHDLVKRFMRKSKTDAVSQLVDIHLTHCARADRLEAENYALQDQVKGLQELMAQQDAQLAEAHALLREIASIPGGSINYHATHMSRIARAALSASAEPSAPARVLGMSLVVDGNMPEGEIHLSQPDGEAVKLTVLPPGHAAKDADPLDLCLHCWGTGTESTGILESSSTICKHCNGAGATGQAGGA